MRISDSDVISIDVIHNGVQLVYGRIFVILGIIERCVIVVFFPFVEIVIDVSVIAEKVKGTESQNKMRTTVSREGKIYSEVSSF